VGWEISANLGRHARDGVDAHGWLWEVVRAERGAQVLVEITEEAWSTEPLDLPEDTRQALETDGRTEVLKVLDRPSPPRVVRCDPTGCRELDNLV
jgi:hypothetical protein